MSSSRTKGTASYLILALGALVVAFPFFWMLSTSLKTSEETYSVPQTLLPESPQWKNYPDAWASAQDASGDTVTFGVYFRNSLFVAACVTAGVLLTSILAAYAFANMTFPGKGAIFVGFLATMMIPFEVAIVPNFMTIYTLGWYNTFPALIVPWMASVFSIFILRQFFKTIPGDYFDAARIDGCGHWRYLWNVAVPMAMPALVTITIFTFLGSWNAFLWPMLVTDSPRMRVVQYGLKVMMDENSTNFHLLMAAAAIVIIPVVALYLVLQRRFIEGVSGAGLKG
jgi:multiple sugar transport system permease protein